MLGIGLQLIAERGENGDSGSQLETTPLGTWPLCASLDRPEKVNRRKCIHVYTCNKYSPMLNSPAATGIRLYHPVR